MKAKYRGVYDNLDDADLGAKVKAKYPQYANFADAPSTAAASPAPPPVRQTVSASPPAEGSRQGLIDSREQSYENLPGPAKVALRAARGVALGLPDVPIPTPHGAYRTFAGTRRAAAAIPPPVTLPEKLIEGAGSAAGYASEAALLTPVAGVAAAGALPAVMASGSLKHRAISGATMLAGGKLLEAAGEATAALSPLARGAVGVAAPAVTYGAAAPWAEAAVQKATGEKVEWPKLEDMGTSALTLALFGTGAHAMGAMSPGARAERGMAAPKEIPATESGPRLVGLKLLRNVMQEPGFSAGTTPETAAGLRVAGEQATQALEQKLVGKEIALRLGDFTARVRVALARVYPYPGEAEQVRLVVQDVATGRIVPATFPDLAALRAAVGPVEIPSDVRPAPATSAPVEKQAPAPAGPVDPAAARNAALRLTQPGVAEALVEHYSQGQELHPIAAAAREQSLGELRGVLKRSEVRDLARSSRDAETFRQRLRALVDRRLPPRPAPEPAAPVAEVGAVERPVAPAGSEAKPAAETPAPTPATKPQGGHREGNAVPQGGVRGVEALPRVQERVHAPVAGGREGEAGRPSQGEGERAGERARAQGADEAAAVQRVRRGESGEAPPGLPSTVRGRVAVQDTPPAGAREGVVAGEQGSLGFGRTLPEGPAGKPATAEGEAAVAAMGGEARSFDQHFEEQVRKGVRPAEARAEAERLSGQKSPAGFDAEARAREVVRGTQEAAGQTTIEAAPQPEGASRGESAAVPEPGGNGAAHSGPERVVLPPSDPMSPDAPWNNRFKLERRTHQGGGEYVVLIDRSTGKELPGSDKYETDAMVRAAKLYEAEQTPAPITGTRGYQANERVSVPYTGRESYFGRKVTKLREKGRVVGYVQKEGGEVLVHVRVKRGTKWEDHYWPEDHIKRLPKKDLRPPSKKFPEVRAKIEEQVGGDIDKAREIEEHYRQAFDAAEEKAKALYESGKTDTPEYRAARTRLTKLWNVHQIAMSVRAGIETDAYWGERAPEGEDAGVATNALRYDENLGRHAVHPLATLADLRAADRRLERKAARSSSPVAAERLGRMRDRLRSRAEAIFAANPGGTWKSSSFLTKPRRYKALAVPPAPSSLPTKAQVATLPSATVPPAPTAKPIGKVKAVLETARKAFDELAAVANPVYLAARTASRSVDVLQAGKGDLEGKVFRTERTQEANRRFWEKMSKEKTLDFLDRLEHGQQPTPALAALHKLYRDRADALHAAIAQYKDLPYWENWFPHLWKNPTRAAEVLVGRRPIEGSKSFLKKRLFEDIRTGLEKGLELRTWNVEEMMQAAEHNARKFLMVQGAIKPGLESLGTLRLARPGMKPGRGLPDDFAQLDGNWAKVYLNPVTELREYFDKRIMEGLNSVADALGIQRVRKVKIGGSRLGYSESGPGTTGRVVTRFATPESVLAHEIGHQLDSKYGLATQMVKDPRFAKELRALADLRFEGQTPTKAFRRYVREGSEKMAVMLEALIHAPESFKSVAPRTYKAFTRFLASHPETKPLLDIRPSLTYGEGTGEIHAGGIVLGGEYWAQRDVARLLNRLMSRDLITEKSIGRGVMASRNFLNAVQLGLSAFHATAMATVAFENQIAIGMRELAVGNVAQKVRGLARIATSPIAPVTNWRTGQRFYAGDPSLRTLERDVFTGGASMRRRAYYNEGAFNHFAANSMRLLRGEGLSAGERAISGAKAAALMPLAAIEAPMKLLTERVIPQMKVGAFRDLFASELELRSKDLASGQVTREQLARETWREIENRMGLLNYDNLYWNQTLKTALMVLIRAPGWRLGTMRALGGAAFIDLPRMAAHVATGKLAARDFTPRMAYALAAVFGAMASGGLYHYLHTGRKPETFEDYVHPQSGARDNAGHHIRVQFPNYVSRDVMHFWRDPVGYLGSGLAPEITGFRDLLLNQGYRGPMHREIKSMDDWLPAAGETMKYLFHSVEPFSVQQARTIRKDAPLEQKAERFLGVTEVRVPKHHRARRRVAQ